MTYNKYKLAVLFRIVILFLAMTTLAYTINKLDFTTQLPQAAVIITPLLLFIFLIVRNLNQYTVRRFNEMDDFFESVKYRDFSRWFTEKTKTEDIRELHKGFNSVNKTVKDINYEKETQHLYLQKILEIVDTGLLAYNTDTGSILWINNAFKKLLDIPSLKNIDFLKKRKPVLYESLFAINHITGNTITVDRSNSKTKLLVTSSSFIISEENYKLIVLQNIDETLNKTESEAWKKLLSVMTHEIMNSIAPISSLAETLQSQIQQTKENPDENSLEINDLEVGIESIKNRSAGLLKFAKTYRSLNTITKLSLGKVLVKDLFENIKILMHPSLASKNIAIDFEIENKSLQITMDRHLIEQVLINLILNAVDACKDKKSPTIKVIAKRNIEGLAILRIVDNGNGIPSEIINDIFIPFFSTKKRGSGVGLSLCKQIVMLHKGKIEVNSVEGKGTAMSLVFLNQ